MQSLDMEQRLRHEIVLVGKALHEKGFVGATDGNISVRLGENRVLVTPSGISKGFLKPENMVVADLKGRVIYSASEGERSLHPSSEFPLHLQAYHQRPDVRAVVHAHPPIAIACSIAGISLDTPVIPEVVVTLGGIPTTPYATPGTSEGAEVIQDYIGERDALLLDHHGVVTVGETAMSAYLKMEKVEHAAQIILAAAQLGNVRPLLPDQVEKLIDIRQRYGLLRNDDRERLRRAAEDAAACSPDGLEALIRRIISLELEKRLQ